MIIRRARVSISGKCSRERAEHIVRSMFQQMHAAMKDSGRTGTLRRADVEALEISFARMDDGTIARAAAEQTGHWIRKGR